MTGDELKQAVADTARMLAASELVGAFGHVSARLPDGGFLITATRPMLGAVVPVHPDLDLIAGPESGDRLALTLGQHHCALLLSNGGLAVGADLLEAATRLWFLEERAQVALAARRTEPAAGDWEQRMAYTDIELIRAKAWFKARFVPASPTPDRE